MICHATDPEAVSYGGDKVVAPGHDRECLGATTLVQRELKIVERYTDFRQYRRDHPDGFTRTGLAQWVNRIVFGSGVACSDPETTDVGIPWR